MEIHELYLSTLFGHYICEVPMHGGEDVGCSPCLEQNLRVRKYYKDVKAASHFDGMHWVCRTRLLPL